MAENGNGNGNGERIKHAAENALLTLASRWIVVVLVPATLGLGAWTGNYVVGRLDEFIKETKVFQTETAKAIGGIDVRLSVTETRVEQLEKGRR